MKDKLNYLLQMAIREQVSDVHFIVKAGNVKVTMRSIHGLKEVQSAAYDVSLFNYLKYLSNLDLGSGASAQSGNFQYTLQGQQLFFRFSVLTTVDLQTGVLRILNNHEAILLRNLSPLQKHYESFSKWTKTRSGLVVLSGPTGSGKTTTLHAILHQIAADQQLRVVSLEDPIEIIDDTYLQLQINEKHHFSYEEGLRELMRHDPDVIMLGEIRDPQTAKMLLRSALSGHMVFSTVHAKCCKEAIKRLLEFGLSAMELEGTLTAVCAQRLYTTKNEKGRMCIYEILEHDELAYYFQHQTLSEQHSDIFEEIKKAVKQGSISSKEASYDISNVSSTI